MYKWIYNQMKKCTSDFTIKWMQFNKCTNEFTIECTIYVQENEKINVRINLGLKEWISK